ncbi:rRNA maturation RNase YbeY [Salegentibacter sp. F188]|uniref:Endoribonuclease YbeY n=1 Tax=Autumnicola patrickiae TaxID=3075591 RepID=A0ABU3E0X0_9FLAO|nr:rRNA maturation RNase YbeY [Salegentibacter sp. F188]MDT0689613.1 rRNA maturation RNase YbeY [Salegentibacter sp. F188]
MINFYSENEFILKNEAAFSNWIKGVIQSEGKKLEEISYIFCNDDYLHKINLEYLDHDTYTDIISFDNTLGNLLQGDIFISTERVAENAKEFNVDFDEELKRVIIHGILHLIGYKDKTESESALMRQKENEKIELFHVEQ